MTRTFVIGDIHGSHKVLSELLQFVFNTEKFDATQDQFLFIGDYVDRGFQSKQVIDELIALKEKYPNTIFLRGNHEDMFMANLGLGGMYAGSFFYNDGMSTLASYLIPNLPTVEEFRKWDRDVQVQTMETLQNYTENEMFDAVPQSHRDFLSNTLLYHDTDRILFVHAGLNPNLKLEENTPFDFLWVSDNRNRFFSQISTKPWHKLMIHGHTPIEPDKVKKALSKNRINVDTGYVYGGRLSCLIVDDGDPKLWKIIQHDGDEISWRF